MGAVKYQQSDFYDILLELLDTDYVEPDIEMRVRVLERAVRDYKGDTLLCGDPKYRTSKNRHIKIEVTEWFQSEEDRPFSFADICNSLDINPDLVRKKFIEDTRPVFPWGKQGRKKNKYFKGINK